MIEHLMDFMAQYKYAAVVALMAWENVFPPVPSEMIMPLAGFLSARGDLSLPGVLAAATLGSVGGALPWYYAGRIYGCQRLRAFAEHHGRWVTISVEDLDKGISKFREHGRKVVVFGRLIPAIRTVISIPAGLVEMPLLQFLAFSAVGSLAWSGLLTAAGFLLEDKYDTVGHYVDPIAKGVLALIVIVYLYRVVAWRKKSA